MRLRTANSALGVVAVVFLLIVSGCAGDDGATDSPGGAGTTSSTTGTSAEESGSVGTSEPPPETTTTLAIDEEIFLEGLDVPEIEQLTPRSGGGHRPLLEWSPVEGAVDYELTFFDREGFLYWAWEGSETSVFLGGVEAPDGTPGPAALEGMSWAVVALDESGTVIAQSRVRSISR